MELNTLKVQSGVIRILLMTTKVKKMNSVVNYFGQAIIINCLSNSMNLLLEKGQY